MADIRCPMCGKPNPADRDTCQHCQARLTPLKAGSPGQAQTPPSQPPGKPEPGASAASSAGDWLSDFRPDESAESGYEESEATSSSSDFGDWFSRLEEPAAPETKQPPQKPLQPGEEALPDWMSELTETPEPAAGQAIEPDWLHGFHTQAAEDAIPGPEKSYEDSGELGASDWLSGLGDLLTPAEEKSGPAETPDIAKPTGLAEPTGFGGFAETSGFEETAEIPGFVGAEGSAESDTELPDWMKPEPDASRQPPASQESVPDWMRELGGEVAGGEVADGEVADSGGAMGELYGIEGAKAIQPEGFAEPTGFAESTGFAEPAGFAGFGESSGFEETAKPTEFGETAESMEFTEPAAEKGEMPEWLKSQMPSAPQAGVPDWLSEASTPAEGQFAEAAEGLSEPAAEEVPSDWFSRFGVTPEEKPAGATPAFLMSDDEMVPFVSGDEMTAGGTISGEMESLPDWISQVPTDQHAPEAPTPRAAPPPELEPQADADLAPAQLPTWLEAMRPVESAAPSTPYAAEEGGSAIETAGPLAGLRGVLPVDAEIARIRKPPVYSNKLQVSEAHQARVSLLEELVAAEGKPRPVAPHITIVPQTALRLAIALVLILTVFGAKWMGEGWTPLPEPKNVPQELDDLMNQITASSANAPVLVAFDYEPGFSGEMEAASAAAIIDLIEKRVPVMFVSTNPLGPALGQRLVKSQMEELNSQLVSSTSPFTSTSFTNLGYIPGGIAGLRAFAENPAQIFPNELYGHDAWETMPVTPTTLAVFSLALVITDNPDTARAWIEQAETLLAPSPLLIIASAQAEPMIRPYYDSGKVQGLVTGLAGGAAYENKRGRSGLASLYWDAFSLSLLVATILILVGGLVNASLSSIARNKRKGEEQPYA